jgi:hypothetical protein
MYFLALVPDFLLYITGNIWMKPNFYLDGLSLEDAEARPDEFLKAEIPLSSLISTLVSWPF